MLSLPQELLFHHKDKQSNFQTGASHNESGALFLYDNNLIAIKWETSGAFPDKESNKI